jgi:hypothetical protein
LTELPQLLSRCTLAVTPDGLAGIPKIALPSALHLLPSLTNQPLDPDLALAPIHLRPAVTPPRLARPRHRWMAWRHGSRPKQKIRIPSTSTSVAGRDTHSCPS